MNRRQFVLPAVSVLGLSVTAACADPLIGTWDATSLSASGHTINMPFSYTYTDTGSGATYTATESLQLAVASDLTGKMVETNTVQADSGTPQTQTYQYALTATKTARGSYSLAINAGQTQLGLSCTLAKKDLNCDSADTGMNVSMVFSKE